MHYFWRGDMTHFSSPLPFQRGACGCRAAAVPQPPRRARRRPRPARVGRPHLPGHLRRARRRPRPARSGHPRVPGCGGPPTPRMARRRPRPARAGLSRSRVAVAGPRPPRPARSCAPSISAGMAPLAGAGQRTPLQTGASQAQPARPKCGMA